MRRLATALVAIPAVVLIAGCNASVTAVTLDAYFDGGTTDAQLSSATTACTGVAANTSPLPQPKSASIHSQLAGNSDEIRFSISKANDKEIAELTDCLNKQPGILGVDTYSAEDD